LEQHVARQPGDHVTMLKVIEHALDTEYVPILYKNFF